MNKGAAKLIVHRDGARLLAQLSYCCLLRVYRDGEHVNTLFMPDWLTRRPADTSMGTEDDLWFQFQYVSPQDGTYRMAPCFELPNGEVISTSAMTQVAYAGQLLRIYIWVGGELDNIIAALT